MSRFVPILAAALLTVSSAVWAQSTPPREPSAQENVRQSEQYERALCGNAAFREKRIKQECGSIDDPQMHESCIASFNCGAAAAPHRRRSNKPPPSETVR
ncbi:MAG TPA: hypothetical protein VHU15_01820 [Stellaceae bacterium]|jgi:hypothetical protein|nr:hypothetical protein [Stellaceae bacterium]